MEVLAENPFLRDVNLFHTAYHPTELMLYFEKHHIFEILFDLMILLDRDRPADVHEFIASKIGKIADKYRKVNISVKCPASTELGKFAKVCSRVHQTPIIQVKRPGSRRSIRKLDEQLKLFRLNRVNLMFVGQNNAVTEDPIPKVFHINRVVDLQNQTIPNDTKVMLPIAASLRNTIKLLERSPDHKHVKYVERIAFIGRPGSGARRQARLLAIRLDLVLVSVTDLINRARTDRNYFKKSLEIGLEDNVHSSEMIATMVQKRLLEPDCLQFGWVLVDFPNTAEDVENLYSLLVVPQKVVNLHTNERLCWKRKLNHKLRHSQNDTENDQLGEAVLKAEFDYFDLHHPEVVSSLKQQDCIIVDVNGNNDVEKVHGDILTKLLK